jgi:ribonuclease T1
MNRLSALTRALLAGVVLLGMAACVQTAAPVATTVPTATPTLAAIPTATVAPTATSLPPPTAIPTRAPDAPDLGTHPPDSSHLPTVRYGELPPEAHETIALIAQGGSFPYRQDGQTFQNRERLLPARQTGYYREYTVITPGSDDRGARRIVGGGNGEMYYTSDHYDSFARIVP